MEESTSIAPVSSSSGWTSTPTPPETVDLRSPSLYLNRELSWLEFNARVLAEAENEAVPLLERLKFHAIVASNLDEFFMVRVAGLKQQLTGEVDEPAPDGMTVSEQLAAISQRVHELVAQQAHGLTTHLLPRLREVGILIVKPEELSHEILAELDARYHNEVFPILTPIAIDPGHPFPHVRNKSLNIAVMFTREGTLEAGFGVVQVPMMLPRLLPVHGVKAPNGAPSKHAFVLLEDLIARHVGTIFPGVRMKGLYVFRVTRNFDIEIDEEEAEDLLQTIQQELRRRERGNAVRLEVAGNVPDRSLAKLVKALKLDPDRDVFQSSGILNAFDLMHVVSRDDRRELRDEPYTPHPVPPLREAEDIFAVLREGDVLLHHPYEAFDHVVELIQRAADDPDVLAIKQTLYRAGGDSPIVKALARAAESGKQVTAIVELKARFDEESNIVWARMLEQSGVHVVYGLLGLKTHCKCLLIVRREKGGKLRRYAHLSTGNYNPTSARMYTDLSLMTTRSEVCEDVSSLFNLLTGYSAPPRWNKLIVSPLGLHEAVLGLIQREAEHARAGRPARIVAKMNSLVDADVIEALYRASQAGVAITLLVRGICGLRPGVPKVSETIEVRAIVDRFLEHGRVFHFANGGKDEVYMASADWMPRNFHRRVEVMFPIDDPQLRARLIDILQISVADNVKSWVLQSDGTYVRAQPKAGGPAVRSQARFIELTRERVKVAEAAGGPSSRFYLAHAAQRAKADGKKERRPGKEREPKKTA
jgi:polyphosphate kinase